MTFLRANNAFIRAFRDAQTINRKTIITIVWVLFENDFDGNGPDESALMKHLDDIVKKNNLWDIDREFAEEAIRGIANKYNEIDTQIVKTSIRPLDEIRIIEINVLRYGVFELQFKDTGRLLKTSYVIKELVEIAKNLLSESTGRFISGILNNLILITQQQVGGVIFRNSGGVQFALVKEAFGQQKWTLPKGRLGENEGLEKGFKRAIREEIGIEVKVVSHIGKNFYFKAEKKRVEVFYFLGKTTDSTLCLEKKPGLSEARWFTYEQVKELDLYSDLKRLMFPAMDEAMKKYSTARFGWLRPWIQNCLKKFSSGLR